jgi:uncharacterized protein involved in outer membrane biogenesis
MRILGIPVAARQARRRPAFALAGLALILFGLLVLALAVDATWLRPLIQQHVNERSQRRIDFTELRFGLNASLDPTVSLRGLQIENAAWAAKRPFASAGEATFTFAWRSLWGEQIVVKRLVLVDADIDMERRADGLRNWRLTRPDDRGPGRVRILSLAARRSALRFVHQGLALELETRIDALATPEVLSDAPALPLTQRLTFHGTRNGAAFDGDVQVSEALTFLDTGTEFAIRGTARVSDARLQMQGRAADLGTLARLDLDLHLSGTRLAGLAPLMAASTASVLPASRPFDARSHLRKRDRGWAFAALVVRLGGSQLAGAASLREAGDAQRREFSADLHGDAIDTDDFAALFANGGKAPLRAAGPAPGQGLDLAPLRASDGRVALQVARWTNLGVGDLKDVKVAATLNRGIVELTPVAFSLQGGHVEARLHVDATQSPAQVNLHASAQGVLLEALLQRFRFGQGLRGRLQGRLALDAEGDSVAALGGTVAGSVDLALTQASIPAPLEARLGLDGGRWLLGLFNSEERVDLHCAQTALVFNQGRGRIEKLLLQTDHTRVVGTGQVTPSNASFDLLLTPRPVSRGWLALDRSIHISGSPAQTRIEIVESKEAVAEAPRCDRAR